MPTTAKKEVQNLTRRQKEGRAVNAVAELLRKTLSVPNIYLEPHAPRLAADVLAVDRAGSGDLHGVQIKLANDLESEKGKNPENLKILRRQIEGWNLDFKKRMREIHKQVTALPVHYKYLAIPQSSCDLVLGELGPLLYSPDGIGRLGIIAIVDYGEEHPTAEIVIAPERFRVDGAKLSKIEKNLINNKKVRPDIEVRI